MNDLWPAKWGDIRESIDATDESMVIAEFAKQIPNTCKTTEMTHTSLFFCCQKAATCSCTWCTEMRECSLLCVHKSLYLEHPVYAQGSLLFALTFFVSDDDLSANAKTKLLRMKDNHVFHQCRVAAVALKAVLPRGIQVYKLGCTDLSWYFSVTGKIQEDSLQEGITFSEMQVGMASILYEGRTCSPLFYANSTHRLNFRTSYALFVHQNFIYDGNATAGNVSVTSETKRERARRSYQKMCSQQLVYLEYPREAPANTCYAMLCQTVIPYTPVGGYYGSLGSLLSALTFFVDLAILPMNVKMRLLSISSKTFIKKNVFQQCRCAAISLRAMLPRGIWLFKFGYKSLSWHFTVFGDVWQESLKDGIEFTRKHSDVACVFFKQCTFVALFHP